MYLPIKTKQARGRRLTALEIAKELEEPINQTGATFDLSRTIDSPQMIVDVWNNDNPIGTSVIVTKDDREEICTKTRSSAWLIGSIPVIQIEGIAGCYALERVRRASLPKPHEHKNKKRIEMETDLKLNSEEIKAINKLQLLAKTFPKTLSLFSANGALYVLKKHPRHPEDDQGRIIQQIVGIANDGGDPDFKLWDDETDFPEWGTKEYKQKSDELKEKKARGRCRR
jgi:hypothetical protein